MSIAAEIRLRRLLGADALASLRNRLRRHYERTLLSGRLDVIRLTGLTREEHAALASMLGRPQRYTQSMQLDIRLLDDGLRRSGVAESLRHALEQLDGRIEPLAAKRRQLEILWAGVGTNCTHSGLAALLAKPSGLGLLKRLAKQPAAAAHLCQRAERVLQLLPAKGIARSQLAAEALGDAHGLDNGRAEATLVLTAWRQQSQAKIDQIPQEFSEAANEVDRSGERLRDVWASAGVLVNELARPALFLNLAARRAGNFEFSPGEPSFLSLRTLLRSPPAWEVADHNIYVCENPNLVAIAADRLGIHCAPMVCIDGMPGVAQRNLLLQLKEAGARLLYHGDFDWPGLRIGNHVMRSHGAVPWRFRAGDYRAATRDISTREGHALTGKTADAFWDSELTDAMRDLGLAVAEEAVATSLLEDLDCR